MVQWWPFITLIGLICVTLVVTTLRRIPFQPVNYGVWMIHTGIITLSLGSVWYFTTKVEGEAPVVRRRMVISIEGQPRATLAVLPGNRIEVGEDRGRYSFDIIEINPDWEILTGEHEGERAYAVSVMVQTPERTFIRQLLDGHPEFTEDVIPGQGRAVKVTGEAILDPTLELSLEYLPQTHYQLVQTEAIFLREVGSDEWIERAIDDLPRYNDHIGSHDEVWPVADGSRRPLNSLNLSVNSSDADDPIRGSPFRITSYLRYAFEDARWVAGGSRIDPVLRLRLQSDAGQEERLELLARDPALNSYAGGYATFVWIDDEARFADLSRELDGELTVRAVATNPAEAVSLSDLRSDGESEFRPIPETEYEWRLVMAQDFQPTEDGGIQSFAIVEIRTPQRTWHRAVFDTPEQARDISMAEGEEGGFSELPRDEAIEMTYRPPVQALLVGGPEESHLRMLTPARDGGQPIVVSLQRGSRAELVPGLMLLVDEFAAHSRMETQPLIVPPLQRRRELDLQFRMIRVELPSAPGEEPVAVWLTYHEFLFDSENEALPGFPFAPTRLQLSDGRVIEMVFSRQRRLLPAPIVLDDFEVDYHVGGFSGDNLSVDEWRAMVRYDSANGYSDRAPVAVNKPGEHNGYWFFQAQWDPPGNLGKNGTTSAGLNYTVLGVGNREGVYVQLLGCGIAVIGMLYAFYVTPILKRRRREAMAAEVRTSEGATETAREEERVLVEGSA